MTQDTKLRTSENVTMSRFVMACPLTPPMVPRPAVRSRSPESTPFFLRDAQNTAAKVTRDRFQTSRRPRPQSCWDIVAWPESPECYRYEIHCNKLPAQALLKSTRTCEYNLSSQYDGRSCCGEDGDERRFGRRFSRGHFNVIASQVYDDHRAPR